MSVLSTQEPRVFKRFDVRKVAQCLHTESGEKMRGRYGGIMRARRRTARSGADETRTTQVPTVSRLTSLPKILLSSQRVTGWKSHRHQHHRLELRQRRRPSPCSRSRGTDRLRVTRTRSMPPAAGDHNSS
jgi:hypothetical protein